MTQRDVMEKFRALPPEAQQQVLDFMVYDLSGETLPAREKQAKEQVVRREIHRYLVRARGFGG